MMLINHKIQQNIKKKKSFFLNNKTISYLNFKLNFLYFLFSKQNQWESVERNLRKIIKQINKIRKKFSRMQNQINQT